ncbi:MAG: hypothetical protein ACREAB_18075 [Blastocatellia bacterium]
MTNNLKITAMRLILALCLIALLRGDLDARISLPSRLASLASAAPQQDEQTRRLWDSEFFKAKKTSPAKRRYRVATPRIPTSGVDENSVLGITLWRLRPSRATDDKEVRLFKHPKDTAKVTEWTPERISVDTPLAVGQRVRLSVEAARTGYLYIINRELYADGTLGDPYLIFPTSKLRGGDNQVSVGRVIDIPALEDEPNYFILDPDRPELVGEVISVLVTPRPLENVKIGEDAAKLFKEDVTTWESSWGARVGRLEMENSFGRAWTKEEKEASKGQTLKPNSPAPQTLYYRPAAKPDESLMVSVRLRYGSVKTKAQ